MFRDFNAFKEKFTILSQHKNILSNLKLLTWGKIYERLPTCENKGLR